MEAVLDRKEKTEVAEKTYIVKFQNLEQKGVPLEFSAGMPITKEILSYVLKDGLVYNVPEKLMEHINDLSYPIYKDVEDPNYPGSGVFRSMQVGVQNRFVLVPMINKPDLVVYEHLRDRLNQKVLPGALSNAANMPESTPTVGDVTSEKEVEKLKSDNMTYERQIFKQTQDIKDLVETVNKLKAEVRSKGKQG